MKLKIESKLIENISITTDNGDIIKVVLDEDGKHSGRATVILYDATGSYYWSAMGKPLKEFIISTPTPHLVGKLFQTERLIPDSDSNAFIEHIYKEFREEIKRIYFDKNIQQRAHNRHLLRYAFDYLKDGEVTQELLYHNVSLSTLLCSLLGNDWYVMDLLPYQENHVYTYQKQVIEQIKTALLQLTHQSEANPA